MIKIYLNGNEMHPLHLVNYALANGVDVKEGDEYKDVAARLKAKGHDIMIERQDIDIKQ